MRQEVAGLSRKKLLITEDIDEVPLKNLGTVDHPEFSLKALQSHYRRALEKLNHALCDHRIGNFYKARYICAPFIVYIASSVCSVGYTSLMDLYNDVF